MCVPLRRTTSPLPTVIPLTEALAIAVRMVRVQGVVAEASFFTVSLVGPSLRDRSATPG